MSQNKKNNVLKQKRLDVNNHSLIYSIGEYRKSVTNLAIGCIRKQSLVGSKPEGSEIMKNDNKENLFDYQKRKISHINFSSVPTKKKRFNYGVTLQSQSHINKHYQQNHQSLTNSTRRYNHKQQINKSYSLLNNKGQNNYLTQPFNIDENRNQKLQMLCLKDIRSNQSYKNLSVIKCNNQKNHTVNSIRQTKKQQAKSKQKLTSFQSIIIGKQNVSLQKPIQTEKSFFKSKQNTIKINLKQQTKPINYPKTQTYTSRSEYNIEKLTNKLDSYIKKHITNY